MNRELNPRLFGNANSVSAANAPAIPDASGLANGSSLERGRSTGYLPLEMKALEGQVQAARAQVGSLEQKLGAVAGQMQEFARSINLRLERFAAALKQLEQTQAGQFQDLTAKQAVVSGKVNERKVNDDKILNLIERHGVLVRNFENRLVTLQRTLSEQELQLHASNAALDEARQELARLKRS